MTVRMGRFGPFVQIGTKDDVEKPRFAGLRPGQKMDSIDLATALELFKLPRALGLSAEGEPVTTAIGRFGPYVKYGAKYVSLKEDDPYTITHERALEVIAAKAIVDANRLIKDFPEQQIQVLNGRYGPYITDKAKNARAPKDRDPKSLTLEECQALLAAAPIKGTRGRFGRGKPAAKGAAAKAAVKAAPTGAAGEVGAAPPPAKRVAKSPAKSAAKSTARSGDATKKGARKAAPKAKVAVKAKGAAPLAARKPA
jgi:DNA topoisomerase-1